MEVPKTIEPLDQVRALMRAFVDWHRQCHAEDIQLINKSFDKCSKSPQDRVEFTRAAQLGR